MSALNAWMREVFASAMRDAVGRGFEFADGVHWIVERFVRRAGS